MSRVSLASYIASAATAPVHMPTGVVIEVVGLIVEVGGLKAGVGDMLRVLTSAPTPLDLEVIGFRAGRLLATPLGPVAGVRPGARVTHSTRGADVPVGPGMLGRIFDAFGDPLDERAAPPPHRADLSGPLPRRQSPAGQSTRPSSPACGQSTPC